MNLHVCTKCGGTYLFEESDEKETCTRCGLQLIRACEWCNKPEKECKCGKDEIELTKE